MSVRNSIVEIHREIDRITHPDLLSKHQYKEVLEELIDDLRVRLDAVIEELKHEQD